MELATITHEQFSAHIGSTFVVTDDDITPGQMTLQEVSTRPAYDEKARVPFTLTFREQESTPRNQGMFTLQHEALGSLEIFLVPIGADANAVTYEAVFN